MADESRTGAFLSGGTKASFGSKFRTERVVSCMKDCAEI